MAYSFTFERLTVGDGWMLAALRVIAQAGQFGASELLKLSDIVQRAFDGDAGALPLAEHQALLEAFSAQYKAFFEQQLTPDADKLLAQFHSGMEQRSSSSGP